jgi:putative ABC transport system ATP-binding protein
MKDVLSLNNVSKSYRDADGSPLDVIHISRLSLATGEQVALVGQSGSGKSTLLNLIAGILLPDSGEILVNSTNITKLAEAARDRFRAANIGYVFQSFNLLQGFTALENVLLGQMFAGGTNGGDRAVKLLEIVGLGKRLHHKPRAMSVGEQQRVAIARALVNEPELLLADEPTGNLDSRTGGEIIELLKNLHVEKHMTLVIATHDAKVAAHAQRAIELADGHIA